VLLGFLCSLLLKASGQATAALELIAQEIVKSLEEALVEFAAAARRERASCLAAVERRCSNQRVDQHRRENNGERGDQDHASDPIPP